MWVVCAFFGCVRNSVPVPNARVVRGGVVVFNMFVRLRKGSKKVKMIVVCVGGV